LSKNTGANVKFSAVMATEPKPHFFVRTVENQNRGFFE